MKKILAVMMCLLMTMSLLTGCGGTGNAGDTENAGGDDGLKIAIVSSPSGVDDGNFNENNYNGILAFIEENPNAKVTPVREESGDVAAAVQAVADIVADYDVIVCCGFQFAGIGALAQENPEVDFILVDSNPSDADGNEIVSYAPENSFTYLIFSDEAMTDGTYTLWAGETQLSGAAGEAMGGFPGMPGGFKPEDFDPENMPEMPEGFDPKNFDPENLPEGMTLPEGFDPKNMPEGMTPPEMPEGGKGAETPQKPEGGNGGQKPQGGGRPGGGRGNRGESSAEVSTEFSVKAGGNYFSAVGAQK